MKRIILALMLALPMGIMAKGDTDAKYLAGAVTEQNGQVVFSKSFRVPGKTDKEITRTMRSWLGQLVEASIEAPGNYAQIMESTPSEQRARVCEWLVFKKKALNLDRARFRYEVTAKIDGDRVTISVANLVYYYAEDMQGDNGQLIRAEEWITDAEALNKAQTKLYPKSGKFRTKTVDRIEEIFASAMDAFEQKQEATPAKPVRHNIVED